MDLKLQKGRPQNLCGRMSKEIKCYDFLDSLGIKYYCVDHIDMPACTMEACVQIDKALECNICKNLFLCNRQKTDFYLLMMPADKPFKTKDLTSQINSARLSFADSEAMQKYLDITPGSVSVLGLINDTNCSVKLLVDKDISLSDLKGTFDEIAKRLFGEECKTRFRPSYYQFTEPSVETDISCFNCYGKGCNICKNTGWITVAGAGMVHPNVLRNCGYDPSKWTGFAFGFGAERLAMLKYGINDIRTFYNTDLRESITFDRKDA